MNLELVEGFVIPGKQRAALEREDRFHALLATQPGVLAAALFRSWGYPGRYARAVFWESIDALYTVRGSAELEAFFEANPVSAVVNVTRPPEGYELVLEVGAAVRTLAPGMHTATVEWTLERRAGVAAAFEQSRRELFELRQKHMPGFVRNSLYRFLGAPNRYLIAITTQSRLGGQDQEATELQAFVAAHPASAYTSTPLGYNTYEVVKVSRPA